MRINILNFFALVVLASLLQCRTGKGITSQEQLFMSSDYIFTGKVVESHASNVPQIKITEHTSIVEVRNVLKASKGHEHFEGMKITVVNDPDKQKKLQKGEEHLFFTKTWLFGETLAVLLNGLNPVSDQIKIKEDIEKYQERFNNEQLKSRIERSQLVFLGKVSEINETEINQDFISEHSPAWKTAFIEVEEPIKGNFPSERIQVYFSSSLDILWYQSPKLQIEKRGIFLLNRRDEYHGLKNVFVLVDKEDFLQESELGRIKEILK